MYFQIQSLMRKFEAYEIIGQEAAILIQHSPGVTKKNEIIAN